MFFWLLVAIVDGLIVGYFLASLCKLLFGDNPFSRLLKLIVSVGAGIGYFIWVLSTANGTEGTIAGFLILAFAPIVLVLILAIIGYIFDQENK